MAAILLMQMCSICFDDEVGQDTMYETRCHHFFCIDCIKSWLVLRHAGDRCPYCTQPLSDEIMARDFENWNIPLKVDGEYVTTLTFPGVYTWKQVQTLIQREHGEMDSIKLDCPALPGIFLDLIPLDCRLWALLDIPGVAEIVTVRAVQGTSVLA
jgi:Ring finger domain